MNPTLNAFVRSWPTDFGLWTTLAVTSVIYVRGWLALHRRDPEQWSCAQCVAFLSGMMALLMALASPIEPFSSLLLQVHMVQHLLLMMVAPPLLWLGAPVFPLLRGLPRPIRTYWAGPLIRSRAMQGFFSRLTHPAVALPIYVGVTWFWHVPAMYEMAMRSPNWHYTEHVCFLAAALLFWYPVVQPYPSHPSWSSWLLIPYLILADVQNTVLSALFTFSPRVLYPYYAEVPRIAGLSPLEDQAAAGVLMWVPGSVAFLMPVFWLGVRLLYGTGEKAGARRTRRLAARPLMDRDFRSEAPSREFSLAASGSSGLTILTRLPEPRGMAAWQTTRGFDLLHVPIVGHFLRWRFGRFTAQLVLAAFAVMIIVAGLTDPSPTAMNLAGVLPWIHWRGLVVLSLLIAGNFFCFACPFTLPRAIAGRWWPDGYRWPKQLRNKWLAIVLLVLFLWAYEAFSLWNSPWLTAWITLAYFAGALAVDGVFQKGSFCKYVCPIGQFNFVQSLVSPFEVRVRDGSRCTTCQTKECIRGSETIAGCDLRLFQPRKSSNLDCTFCLTCTHACPHQNVGVLLGLPGQSLWHDRFQSGVGRIAARPDLAVLIIVLVFGAFANAGGMIVPVVAWHDTLRVTLGLESERWLITAYYSACLIVAPAILIGAAAGISRLIGNRRATLRETAVRFSYALAPIGFAMWLAHYGFHFMTSYASVVPATQRFVAHWGVRSWGTPRWASACCFAVADWIPRAEILILDLGLLLSMYAAFQIAGHLSRSLRQRLLTASPWTGMIVLLFAVGVWIVLEPMEMRGMLDPAELKALTEARP